MSTDGLPILIASERAVCARLARVLANVRSHCSSIRSGSMSKTKEAAKLAGFCIACTMLPSGLHAESQAALARIGFLAGYQCSGAPIRNFMAALNDLGWVEGKNVEIQCQTPAGNFERFPAAVADLLAWQPDVILAFTNISAFAITRVDNRVPIVVFGATAAVEMGLVSSLAKPGGNVTGVESLATQIDAKRLEILKMIVPRADRLAVLYNPLDKGSFVHVKLVSDAAQAADLDLSLVEIKGAEHLDDALAQAVRVRPAALLAFTDVVIFNNWKRIAELARERRMLTLCEFREMARAGCLLSYGPDLSEFGRITARQVDRILKGTKPAELPMEMATRFKLVINMATARELGITIPRNVLLRADELIE